MNYASITALMAVESSFIPFPSEVVIPPAAFVAGQPDSVLCTTGNYPVDVLLIILFGTLGAMIGAIINYGLSVWLGRIVIYKFADSRLGHLCLLSSEKIQRAEEYFREKGNVSTFVGRFIPGIRQLISIPAGLSRMHFGAFLWWTFLGAFIWNCILAVLGYVAAGQMDLIKEYSHELSVAILVLLGAVILYYLIRWIIKKRVKA
jgi:membrane protein DedA with SNARE-associated domain